jgi:hypothetical protein
MWQAVDLFSDWLVRIPRQARLVYVGKGSTRETAAVLGCSKNRIKLRGVTAILTVTGEAHFGGCSADHKNRR